MSKRLIDEPTALAMAAKGVIPPHKPTDRPWLLDILREAEGRALEFDHTKRADKFGAMKKTVEAMR